MKTPKFLASILLAAALPCAQALAAPLVFDAFALDNRATAAQEGAVYTRNVVDGVAENPLTGQWALRSGGIVVNNQMLGGDSYGSFCIEPLQSLRFGDVYNNFQWRTLGSQPLARVDSQADRINKLYESSYDLSLQSAENSAAFQLALWEVLLDDSLDLASGRFQTFSGASVGDTPQAVMTGAKAMLTGLDSRALGDWDFFVLENAVIQDQLIATRRPATDVPLPGSVALLAVGLAGMGWRRRRSLAAPAQFSQQATPR